MEERPDAEIHADRIGVKVTENGKFALLHILNDNRSLSVSIARRSLLEFLRLALTQLEITSPGNS